MNEEEDKEKEESVREEITRRITEFYILIETWMRPNKSQPVVVQILVFILKLPVLILLLLLSPVLFMVLLLLFILAL